MSELGPNYSGGGTITIGENIPVVTFANLPAPGPQGSSIFVSNVGVGGSEWQVLMITWLFIPLPIILDPFNY